MTPTEAVAREKILDAVKSLLDEGVPSDTITVRQIAQRAGVGIGSINYHFASKEKLVFDAVIDRLQGHMAGLMEEAQSLAKDPVQRLKQVLMSASRLVMENTDLLQTAVSYDLTQGDLGTAYYFVPLIRDICGEGRSDREIKLMAFSLISTMQAVFIKSREFARYAGVDISDEGQLQETIDTLIDITIGGGA